MITAKDLFFNWQNDYVAIMNIGCTIQVAEIKQVTEKDETEPSKLEQTKHF